MPKSPNKTDSPLTPALRVQLRETIARCYRHLTGQPGSPDQNIQQAVLAAIEEVKQKASKNRSEEETGVGRLGFKPRNAKKAFERYVKDRGLRIKHLPPGTGFTLMCAFYFYERADGCAVDADGDMLLYQWGTYNSKFQLSITRQFMTEPCEDEDMSQLSLIFRFAPTSESAALGSGNKWFKSPQEVQGHIPAFIVCSAPFRAFSERPAEMVELVYQDGL